MSPPPTWRSAPQKGQLAVVENSLITRRGTVQLTEWLEQAGTGDALDTQRSLTTLEQARTTMPALRLSIEQARNQLAFLSGRTPGSLDAQLARPRSVPEMPAGMATGIPRRHPAPAAGCACCGARS